MLRGIVCLSAFASILAAQGSSRITGSVVDPSGAAVPKATVNLLLHGGRRALYTTVTSNEGLFAIEALRPELYDISVESTGFQTLKVESVKVDPARTTDLPALKLSLASTAQSIDVVANTEAVQTTSTDISTTVTAEQIRRLPVGDRNVVSFINTQVGVSGSVNETSINGQRSSFSNVTQIGRASCR